MSIDNNFINEVKDKANIVDIISNYVDLKNNGSNYKSCCPFHNENTPSFVVSENKQIFKCFGCGKSGDVIKFIEEIENVDFIEALKILAEKLNIELPQNNKEGYSTYEKANAELKEINTESARFFYKNLINTPTAIDYLKNRGILPEMIKEFGIGYADNSFDLLNMLKKTFPTESLIGSGVFVQKNEKIYSRFRNRIMFPIFDSRNKVIAFGGRQMDDYGPKYLNSPETKIFLKKDNLYGFHIAKKNLINKSIFLVEGYMDVIKMHQFGYKNTVASLGTSLTIEQAKLIKKTADKLYIIYDSDNAGIQASLRALEIALQEGLEVKVVSILEAKDPDEFLSKFGNVSFEKLLDKADDYLIFNIKNIKNKYKTDLESQKIDFLKESVEFIKKYLNKYNSSHIFVENAIYFLATESGYSIKAIGQDIFGKYFSIKQFSKNDEIERKPSRSDLNKVMYFDEFEIDKKEKMILANIIMGNIELEYFSINDFSTRENRMIYANIFHKNSKETDHLKEYYSKIESEEMYILKKNMRNISLDKQINKFEEIQLRLLESIDESTLDLALTIGQHIINLNNKKINK
ncbi:DNA primase [Proteocatella sphenisci]|uniref:DNA primase n=1 Tax=Proteocatella sphenisci TaxID=181070 RepID=UPI0004BA6845|nr:DNA primase [Proteocatella sphenisci]